MAALAAAASLSVLTRARISLPPPRSSLLSLGARSPLPPPLASHFSGACSFSSLRVRATSSSEEITTSTDELLSDLKEKREQIYSFPIWRRCCRCSLAVIYFGWSQQLCSSASKSYGVSRDWIHWMVCIPLSIVQAPTLHPKAITILSLAPSLSGSLAPFSSPTPNSILLGLDDDPCLNWAAIYQWLEEYPKVPSLHHHMDTSKPISHPTREKSTSSSTTGRRSPRPSSSPVRRLPEKTTAAPHHLKSKPTPSTTNAAAKSPLLTTAAKRQPITKPMEKAPSPSPRPGRTLSSSPATTRTNREKSPKPPSPSPMPMAYYQRTSLIPLPKAQKTPVVVKSTSASAAKTAKPGVDTRSKSLEKRKVIATPSAFVETSLASDSEATIAKAELIKAAKEGENELLVHVYVNNSLKKPEEEQEHGGVVSPVQEQQKEVNIDDIVVDHDQQHVEKQSGALVAENKEVDGEERGKVRGIVSPVHEQLKEVDIDEIVVDHDQHDEKQSEALVAENKEVNSVERGKVGGVVSPVHEQQKEVNVDDIVVDRGQQHDEKQSEALLAENEEVDREEGGKREDKESKAEEEVKQGRGEAMHKSPRKPMAEPVAQEVRPAEAASLRGVAAAAKKEAQRSNDVIEEAKSKFLEKRKNKVLALVGAFETVMAMQEPEVQQVQPQVKGKETEAEITTPSATNEPNEPTEPIDSTEPSEPTELTEATESMEPKESTGESTEVTE